MSEIKNPCRFCKWWNFETKEGNHPEAEPFGVPCSESPNETCVDEEEKP